MQQHLGLEQQLGEMGMVTQSGFKMREMIQSAYIDILWRGAVGGLVVI